VVRVTGLKREDEAFIRSYRLTGSALDRNASRALVFLILAMISSTNRWIPLRRFLDRFHDFAAYPMIGARFIANHEAR